MSSSLKGRSSNICDRETSGELTKKKGLCVVAPTSFTTPASTSGSNTSCCALLNRWISSTKRIVGCPVFASRFAAEESPPPHIGYVGFHPAQTLEFGTGLSRNDLCQ